MDIRQLAMATSNNMDNRKGMEMKKKEKKVLDMLGILALILTLAIIGNFYVSPIGCEKEKNYREYLVEKWGIENAGAVYGIMEAPPWERGLCIKQDNSIIGIINKIGLGAAGTMLWFSISCIILLISILGIAYSYLTINLF